MKLEDQVCSLEMAKKLKELGVKQESLFGWYEYTCDVDKKSSGNAYIAYCDCVEEHEDSDASSYFHSKLIASAFTVAELGEMLKESEWRLPYVRENGRWWTGGFDDEPTSDTEADARAKMLVWVMECELKK